jgi:hypothetical protein
MLTGAIILGAPAPVDPTRAVIVACPTCGWWEQSIRVRQSCPVDDLHDAPVQVYVFVECDSGCGGDWFRRLPTHCGTSAEHRLVISEFRRVS